MKKMNLFFSAVCTLLISFSLFAAPTSQDILKQSKKDAGFFNIYKHKDGKVFIELSNFNQEFIYQTSVVSGLGSNDVGIDRGKLADTQIVVFEKSGNKVFLKKKNLNFRADTQDKLEAKTISEAFADSIVWANELIPFGKNKYLVDITSLILTDNQNIINGLTRAKQGAFNLVNQLSTVALDETKSFPKNAEFTAQLTFHSKNPGEFVKSVAVDPKSITLKTRHSFIELPDNDYQPRAFHPYSGYWALGYENYAAPVTESMSVRFIPRHRLKKKFPDQEKSEAVEPIVYYLDAGTPEPVRSALLDGARWWNQAFEAAGYINAFQVKMLPADADPMDVRYNTIQWIHRSTRGWSYGGAVVDPRTGEIIKGHVSLGSLRVRQDLLIALGLVPRSETNGQDSQQLEMALARIRQLSAHEIGHTIGIAHNFSASTNDRASVMDYPHPHVEIKGRSLSLENAYAVGMGAWDIHSVKYGYSDFGDKNEAEMLNKLIKEAKAAGLRYMSDPDARSIGAANPYGSLWDNGEDAAAELARISKVRDIALSKINQSVLTEKASRSDFQEALVPIYYMHRYQVQAAAKIVGCYDYYYQLNNEPDHSKVCDDDWQQRALESITNTLKPEFLMLDNGLLELLQPKAYGSYRNRESFPSKTGVTNDYLSIAEASMHHGLTWLLNHQRLNRIADFNARRLSDISTQSVLKEIIGVSWQEKKMKGMQAKLHQRLNFVVADHLLAVTHNGNVSPEVRAIVKSELANWAKKLRKAKSNTAYQGHYVMLAEGIVTGLNNSAFRFITQPAKMPPGSPI